MSLPSIGPLELIIILAIALLIVGPKRLPEMGNAFGRTIREFRKATSDVSDSTSVKADGEPVAAPVAPVAPESTAASAAPIAPEPVATPATEAITPATEAITPSSDANDDASRPA
jgi:sec-independent protein translocase protein TatA